MPLSLRGRIITNPFHFGGLLPIFQSTATEEVTAGTKRFLHVFDFGDITTEFTVGYNASLTLAGTYGATIVVMSREDATTAYENFGINHGNGANNAKCNSLFYANNVNAYEIWQDAVSTLHDSADYIADSPRKYLFRCSPTKIDLWCNGALVHTYSQPFQADYTSKRMGVFIGGFRVGDTGTTCSATIYKTLVFDYALPDEEVAAAFALLG
jgi:hypothetical protein